MKQETIFTVDAAGFPQMETKWFKVTFSPDEPNVHHKIYAFFDYVENRSVLNTDLHFIESFHLNEFGKISYERLLKTNSTTYLNELKLVYTLEEINKPENVIERTETHEQYKIIRSISLNNNLAKVTPERHPDFGEFTAEILSYNDVGVVFRRSSDSINFPYNRDIFSLVYWNIFDIKEVVR